MIEELRRKGSKTQLAAAAVWFITRQTASFSPELPFIAGKGNRFIRSPQRPVRIWGPPSHLFGGYRALPE